MPHTTAIASHRPGFTILELEVAIVILALGMVTLASLISTQARMVRRLQGEFRDDATISLNHSPNPWLRRLHTQADVNCVPLPYAPLDPALVTNDVTVEMVTLDLVSTRMEVMAKVVPAQTTAWPPDPGSALVLGKAAGEAAP